MTRREIVEVGHPVLRERGRELTLEELRSAEVQGQIDGMIETLRIAVAGVRQGHPRYPYKPPIPLTVIVDPVIEPLVAEIAQINEGCLSVADLRGEVLR